MLIVNTRPEQQAKKLTQSLIKLGHRVIELPLIQIQPINFANKSSLQAQIDQSEMLVFVSKNAVDCFFRQFRLKQQQLAVTGRASYHYLKQYCSNHILFPEAGSDSEALLEQILQLPQKPRKVMIVRGVGGREFLAQQLGLASIMVQYLEVYRRLAISWSHEDLANIWQQPIDFLLITSSEAAQYLCWLSQQYGLGQIMSTPIITIHQKIADKLVKMGFQAKIRVTQSTDDTAIQAAIEQA